MNRYKPEGINNIQDKISKSRLQQAYNRGDILEGTVYKIDKYERLYIQTEDNSIAIINKEDVAYNLDGKNTKDCEIYSRVGKRVKFKVKSIEDNITYCSRLETQKECYDNYISKMKPGDIISVRISHVDKTSIFCDIGCGIYAILPFENVTVAHISNIINDKTFNGNINVVVKHNRNNKIVLSHKELLGNWEDNIADLQKGDSLIGYVTDIKEYGIFVYLNQNIYGLAELEPRLNINIGDKVLVYLRHIDSDKLKINLYVRTVLDKNTHDKLKFNYKINKKHISSWKFSPELCNKTIETRFE